MGHKYSSFQAGFTDTLKEFGMLDVAKPHDFNFLYPNEDKAELDIFEYLRGEVKALKLILKNK